MSAAGWIAIAVLGAGVVWLGLSLAGAVRELASLRARVAALEEDAAGPVRLADGLAVGTPAPAWSVATTGGGDASSASMRGARHLILFADAECRACDDLVPAVVEAASNDRLPPTVVVGGGDATSIPTAWRSASGPGTVIVGVEREQEVSNAFGTEVSPHAFVVDEGGFIAAQGGPLTLDDVHELIADAEGLHIVSGNADG